jgi:hypothetical protein
MLGHQNGSVAKLKAAKLDGIISIAYELINPERALPKGNDVVIAFDLSSPVKDLDDHRAPSSPVDTSDGWYT